MSDHMEHNVIVRLFMIGYSFHSTCSSSLESGMSRGVFSGPHVDGPSWPRVVLHFDRDVFVGSLHRLMQGL